MPPTNALVGMPPRDTPGVIANSHSGPKVNVALVWVVLPVSSTKVAVVPLSAGVPVMGSLLSLEGVARTQYLNVAVDPVLKAPTFHSIQPDSPIAG
ncbi:MAG TPA: hypothetical protein PLN26_04340 [Acidobacteriota bacterium]|nr:hypothetical protein [Acidobacteriota bacterium]HQG90320.1 hypothetical protein [Acidobacteriota bacterium]